MPAITKPENWIPTNCKARIVDSSNFNAAYACLRQVSFGLLDMAWYTRNAPFEGDVKAYEKKAWEKHRFCLLWQKPA